MTIKTIREELPGGGHVEVLSPPKCPVEIEDVSLDTTKEETHIDLKIDTTNRQKSVTLSVGVGYPLENRVARRHGAETVQPGQKTTETVAVPFALAYEPEENNTVEYGDVDAWRGQ